MKIACFVADSGGCAWYRLCLPYGNLQGHEVRFFNAIVTPAVYWADVGVFQRVDHPDVIGRMREMVNVGKTVIMDWDDNLHNIPRSNPCARIFNEGTEGTKNFETAMGVADYLTCSTQRLAAEYERFDPDIRICENFISSKHVAEMAPSVIYGEPKRQGQIRIGYVGSPTHGGDVSSVSQALSNVAKQNPAVQFVFFGQKSMLPQKFADRTEFTAPIVADKGEAAGDFMRRYYRTVKSLDIDIAVAPLKDNVFNDCKSAIKMLEIGMLGIPIVASDYGPYREYHRRGGPVITAGEQQVWEWQLNSLIASTEMRREYGQKNLAYIRQNCTEKQCLSPWEALLGRIT